MRIEEGIKEYILEEYPHLKDNVMFHVLLTYQVQGSFYAQKQNIPRFGSAQVLQAVDRISAQFEEMMKEQNDTWQIKSMGVDFNQVDGHKPKGSGDKQNGICKIM